MVGGEALIDNLINLLRIIIILVELIKQKPGKKGLLVPARTLPFGIASFNGLVNTKLTFCFTES